MSNISDQQAELQQSYWDRLAAQRKAEVVRRREERKLHKTTPVVTLKRLRCPRCGSLNCKTTGTLESSLEIVSRRKRCQDCDLAFIEILD